MKLRLILICLLPVITIGLYGYDFLQRWQVVAGDQSMGAINVPVAVLWTVPGPKREQDQLILSGATRPADWAHGMDNDSRLWLVGKVETQALYGERVEVLERKGSWLKVAAVAQKTLRDHRGYPGWVPADQVSSASTYLSEGITGPEVVVAVPRAGLYRDPSLRYKVCELSYQTRLPLLSGKGLSFEVRLPNGSKGYLKRTEVKKAHELFFSPSGIVQEGRRFLGLKYIWGGTSSFGYDCSGFVYRIYRSQGILISRDAGDQAGEGIPVAKRDLLPGDLLFFASDEGKGSIHHVGIYTGNGLMLHAPHSRSCVREEAFNTGIYGKEYWGARRYHP